MIIFRNIGLVLLVTTLVSHWVSEETPAHHTDGVIQSTAIAEQTVAQKQKKVKRKKNKESC